PVAAGLTQRRLAELDVPVAQLAPEEVVEPVARLVEAEQLELPAHLCRRARQPREDPALRRRETFDRQLGLHARLAHSRQAEAGGVPDLVAEVAVALHALAVHRDVA